MPDDGRKRGEGYPTFRALSNLPPKVGRAAGLAARVTFVLHPRARRTWPEARPGQSPPGFLTMTMGFDPSAPG
jgi:hypothetical protein